MVVWEIGQAVENGFDAMWRSFQQRMVGNNKYQQSINEHANNNKLLWGSEVMQSDCGVVDGEKSCHCVGHRKCN